MTNAARPRKDTRGGGQRKDNLYTYVETDMEDEINQHAAPPPAAAHEKASLYRAVYALRLDHSINEIGATLDAFFPRHLAFLLRSVRVVFHFHLYSRSLLRFVTFESTVITHPTRRDQTLCFVDAHSVPCVCIARLSSRRQIPQFRPALLPRYYLADYCLDFASTVAATPTTTR